MKYPYDDKGGLRYYANTYKNFKNIFSVIGYIELDIAEKNQMTFDNFIEKISPNSSENWIKVNILLVIIIVSILLWKL